MGKPFEVSDMPPLSREMHGELRQLERGLNRDLLSCCAGYSLVDEHAAFEYTRTAAIEFFDCFYAFYSKTPDPAYREHWKPASERFALGRIVKCIENITAVESYFKRSNDRVERIKRTISDHAKSAANSEDNHPAPTGRQASLNALAGIDPYSDSPLLKMARAASTRPAVFSPVSLAPRQRIGRSIHSESAARRMEKYIEQKGISLTQFCALVNIDPKTIYRFRQTGKVSKSIAATIAVKMGITLDALLE
jgi:hypothetical protein